jgi:transposase
LLCLLIAETGPVSERLRVREIDDDEGRRLVRIVRRGTGSVVTWRRAQMVLLSAQGMDAAAIAKVAFTSEDRVRDVIRNFNADGFGSLYPRYKGGHPPKFTLGQRREIKKIAKARPVDYDLPFSVWSLAKLADARRLWKHYGGTDWDRLQLRGLCRGIPRLVGDCPRGPTVIGDLGLTNDDPVSPGDVMSASVIVQDAPGPGTAAVTRMYDGREVPGRVIPGPLSAALSGHLGRAVYLFKRSADHLGGDDCPVTLMSEASPHALAPEFSSSASGANPSSPAISASVTW